MPNTAAAKLFTQYTRAVRRALEVVAESRTVGQETLDLNTLEVQLLAVLNASQDMRELRAKRSATAQELRNSQVFTLSWRSGGSEQVISWAELAKRLHMRQSSIRVLLSKGKGNFDATRRHPQTGEPDIVTIHRATAPQPPKRKPGRPSKMAGKRIPEQP